MPFVAKPDRFSSDAIIPGRVDDPLGWVTEHTTLEGINGPITLYFSVTGLRQLAEKYPQIGLVSAEELETLTKELACVALSLEQAEARADEAEAKLERISGLQRDGFKVARVQGRPPTKQKAAA
jgi:hypothetical protein